MSDFYDPETEELHENIRMNDLKRLANGILESILLDNDEKAFRLEFDLSAKEEVSKTQREAELIREIHDAIYLCKKAKEKIAELKEKRDFERMRIEDMELRDIPIEYLSAINKSKEIIEDAEHCLRQGRGRYKEALNLAKKGLNLFEFEEENEKQIHGNNIQIFKDNVIQRSFNTNITGIDNSTTSLVDYVRRLVKNGKSEAEIIKILFDEGYRISEIDNALNAA